MARLAAALDVPLEKLEAKDPDDLLSPRQLVKAVRLSHKMINLRELFRLSTRSTRLEAVRLLFKQFPKKARRDIPGLPDLLWKESQRETIAERQSAARWLLKELSKTPAFKGVKHTTIKGKEHYYGSLSQSIRWTVDELQRYGRNIFKTEVLTGLKSLDQAQILTLAHLLCDHDSGRFLADNEINKLLIFARPKDRDAIFEVVKDDLGVLDESEFDPDDF